MMVFSFPPNRGYLLKIYQQDLRLADRSRQSFASRVGCRSTVSRVLRAFPGQRESQALKIRNSGTMSQLNSTNRYFPKLRSHSREDDEHRQGIELFANQ